MPPKTFSSAPPDCSPEDICIRPVVIAELKFRDVQRQVLLADTPNDLDVIVQKGPYVPSQERGDREI